MIREKVKLVNLVRIFQENFPASPDDRIYVELEGKFISSLVEKTVDPGAIINGHGVGGFINPSQRFDRNTLVSLINYAGRYFVSTVDSCTGGHALCGEIHGISQLNGSIYQLSYSGEENLSIPLENPKNYALTIFSH